MPRALPALLWFAGCLYGIHALVTAIHLFRSGQQGAVRRWGLLAAALLLHTAFVVSRAFEARGLPTETRLDSLALFLWVLAVVFAVCERPYRLGGVAPLFWPLFTVGAVAALVTSGREATLGASLDRFWLGLHLVPVYAGYAGFAVAAGGGLGYMVQERLLRTKAGATLWRKFPSLEALERLGRAALSLGFPALTVGLVAGVVWAARSSAPLGRAWYTDPKVVGGLVVWLFYAAVLHARLSARVRGRRAALLTILGFLLTVASFLAAHLYEGPAAEPAGPRTEVRADAP